MPVTAVDFKSTVYAIPPQRHWCPRQDLNLYARRGQLILSQPCMPFHHAGIQLAGMLGLEPRQEDSRASVLPLHHIPIW